MVIALNMMDEVRSNGGTIDVRRMSEELGVPVIPISAVKNEGVDEVVRTHRGRGRAQNPAQGAGFLPGRPGAPLHTRRFDAHRGPRAGHRHLRPLLSPPR